MAFDYGSRRIGVAVGNTLMRVAEGLSSVDARRHDLLWQQIDRLLREWQPEELIVGRPLHPDGNSHAFTARCERFARQLRGRFGLAVHLVDERYTSVLAMAERACDVDRRAAELILQSFFDQLPAQQRKPR